MNTTSECIKQLKICIIQYLSFYVMSSCYFTLSWAWKKMNDIEAWILVLHEYAVESQSRNFEFRINPEDFHPYKPYISWFPVLQPLLSWPR